MAQVVMTQVVITQVVMAQVVMAQEDKKRGADVSIEARALRFPCGKPPHNSFISPNRCF